MDACNSNLDIHFIHFITNSVIALKFSSTKIFASMPYMENLDTL